MMKKTLLTVIFGISLSFGFAQNLVIPEPVTTVYGTSDNIVYIKMHIKNNGIDPTEVFLQRKIQTLIAGQLSYFCFGINCYPPNVNKSPENISLNPGAEDSSVKTYIDPRGNAGTSIVKYCFYSVSEEDSACLILTYDVSATSIVNNSHLKFVKVFPNPVTEEMKLAFNTEKVYSSSEIQIVDLNGRIVYAEKVETKDGLIAINISVIPAGVYVCNLVGDGVTIARDKILVK